MSYNFNLLNVDKIVLQFRYLVQSGLLPKTHVFFELMRAFCSRALGYLSPVSNFSDEFPAFMSWLQSNQLLHGKSATHFFSGVGGHEIGHLGSISMSPTEWIQTHNFAGISPRAISAMNPVAHAIDGVKIDDVRRLFCQLKETNAISLERKSVIGFLTVTASDAKAIKPDLQVSLHHLSDPHVPVRTEEVNSLMKKPEIEVLDNLKTFNTK